MAHIEDKRLALQGGRILAYADSGNTASSTVVIFFHGAFSVGNTTRISRVVQEKDFHYIAPTLPGWGNSSPISPSLSFAAGLAADTTALLTHLHPNDTNLKLYVGGGSYGTVPAQMLYGACYDTFPLGRHIAGLLLLGPLSPPRAHSNYAQSLPWQNYFMIGPPSQYIPFKLVARMGKLAMGRSVGSAENAEVFVRGLLFDKMDEAEREAFAQWRDAQGVAEGQLEREMAQNIARSVAKSWQGYLDIPDVFHSDWGFSPSSLDPQHAQRPVLVVASSGDDLAPGAMANWLVTNYKNARLKVIHGGHIAAIFHFDEIWRDFLEFEG